MGNVRWFYAKKRQIGKGNLYLTENRLGRNEIGAYGVWKMIAVICVTYVQKDFLIRTWIKQLLTKYQSFKKLPKFHVFTKVVIFKV